MEFADLLGSVQKDRFKSLTNKLLNDCYIVKKENPQDYSFVLQNRELFASLLDILGYQLIVQTDHGVIGINNPAGTGRIHLRTIDSVLLLILRLIYIEEREKLTQFDEVKILVDQIYDKYNLLNLKGKLDKVTLRSAMSLFKKYNLIKNLDSDMSNKDTEIIIYPSILLAIQNQTLNEMYDNALEKLESYKKGDIKDAVEFTEEDEVFE